MFKGCCEWFDSAMSTAGEKGYAVLPFHEGDSRKFFLQARPFERDFDVQNTLTSNSVAVAVAVNASIKFCPHCGIELRTLIASQRSEFDSVALKVAKLIPWK